jgi:hypothetical protein
MKFLRRILGVLVMITGILGLLLALAGLTGVWIAKPTVSVYADATIDTLSKSVITSKSVMATTGEALGATIDSVDALSAMLGTTAATVQDTKPVLNGIEIIMGTTLPSTLEAAATSLYTAQEAAQVLEGTIESLNAFRALLSDVPLIGGFVGQPAESYNPEVPLADSLGELAVNLESLPATFVEMSADLSATDGNLAAIQENLITMSDSVGLISVSLSEYQSMVIQSQSSMDDLAAILTNIQTNMPNILNGAATVLSLFFVWLLIAQIVILSQGWELFHGTANRMQ